MSTARSRLQVLCGHLQADAQQLSAPAIRTAEVDAVAAAAAPHFYVSDQDLVKFNKEKNEHELQPVNQTLTFDQGLFYSVRAVELLKELHPDKVVIVGIAGPTGSGKTAIAERMASVMGALILDMAHFVKIEKVIDQNYEDLTVMDFHAIAAVLKALKSRKPAAVPSVNFETKKRMPSRPVECPESNVVILEGLYALNEGIRSLLDVTIAIEGGVHLDLIKRITRDIQISKHTSKDVILQVTNVLFPMFKAFTEPDMVAAKIRINSSYNPITAWTEPTYVCKTEYARVKDSWDEFVTSALPNIAIKKRISDMYLYPPGMNGDKLEDMRNWIRIRQVDGLFYVHFYNEISDETMNVRPGLNFEISVQTISGLLTLGYEIGAIVHRTTETWLDQDGTTITLEHIQELEQAFVQVKGTNRSDVINKARRLKMQEHHIRDSFLQLYLRKFKNASPDSLAKQQRDASEFVQQPALMHH